MKTRAAFTETDLAKIREFFDFQINTNHFNHLIQKFPRVFHKIIRDFQAGKLENKLIQIPDTFEKIKFEIADDPSKIKARIIKDPQAMHFTQKFKAIVQEICHQVDIEEEVIIRKELKERKSLMECGFNKTVLKQIENSLKDEDYW